jgi:hypothetical protein
MLSAEFEMMIRDVSRSFAKRLVQEAAMQENYAVYFHTTRGGKSWLDNWGYTLDQAWERRQELLKHYPFVDIIPMQDRAQELIGRMCAAPLVIQYEEGDELVHTASHPFCGDETCPCHDDKEAWHRECGFPVLDGLMTESEASRLFYGKQV